MAYRIPGTVGEKRQRSRPGLSPQHPFRAAIPRSHLELSNARQMVHEAHASPTDTESS
jgi:hypothetical protein